jgi:hypothetical protein
MKPNGTKKTKMKPNETKGNKTKQNDTTRNQKKYVSAFIFVLKGGLCSKATHYPLPSSRQGSSFTSLYPTLPLHIGTCSASEAFEWRWVSRVAGDRFNQHQKKDRAN